jgi:hypothetical protein
MQPVHNVFNPYLVQPPAIHRDPEALLRIRTSTEIAALKDRISVLNCNDRLSQDLILWLTTFESAMRAHNLQECVDRHIGYLQRLLQNPIAPHPPLDEEVFLGSDGHSYGKKFLSIFLTEVEEKYRGRSPLAPADPSPFTVTKHYVAEEFVAWLKTRGALLRCRELEEDYETLFQTRRLAPLPFPPPPGRGTEEEEIERLLEELDNLPDYARQMLDPVMQEAADNHAEETRRMDRLELAQDEAAQFLQNEIDRLNHEIREHEMRGEEIRRDLADLRQRYDEAERANLEVQQGIHTLEAVVKRREESSMRGFLQFAGTFAISLAVTLAISYFAPGSSLAPMINGGYLLRYTKFL